MTANTREIGFEDFIEQELVRLHGFLVRKNTDFDPNLCLDKKLVLEFWQKTQDKQLRKLAEMHGTLWQERILERLDTEIENRGVLDVLRKGINDRGVHLDILYIALLP